jgi:hypothetical protein
MADLVAFSTDFRQFEQYLNVPGLDVCFTCVLPLHFPIFTFHLDSRYRQQLYIPYTPGMT